jgi:hypothetical protein
VLAVDVAILLNVRGTSWQEKPRRGLSPAGFEERDRWDGERAAGIMASPARKATAIGYRRCVIAGMLQRCYSAPSPTSPI